MQFFGLNQTAPRTPQIDSDGGGEIDYTEFGAKLGLAGQGGGGFQAESAPPPRRAAAAALVPRLNNLSADKIMSMIKEKVEAKSKNVRTVFRGFDGDKSGFVDHEEFRQGLTYIGVALTDSEMTQLLAVVSPPSCHHPGFQWPAHACWPLERHRRETSGRHSKGVFGARTLSGLTGDVVTPRRWTGTGAGRSTTRSSRLTWT